MEGKTFAKNYTLWLDVGVVTAAAVFIAIQSESMQPTETQRKPHRTFKINMTTFRRPAIKTTKLSFKEDDVNHISVWPLDESSALAM